MRILVEHDELGTLRAVSLLSRASEGEGHSARVRRPGQQFTEVDLPDAVAELAAQLESGAPFAEAHVHQLRTLIAHFRLDATQGRPRLVRR